MMLVHNEPTQPGAPWEISWTDVGVRGLVAYYYAIVAVDGSTNISIPSAVVTARGYDEALPTIPTLTATWDASAARLEWASDDETQLEYHASGSAFWAADGSWRAAGAHEETLNVDPDRSWVFRLRVRRITGAVLAGASIELAHV
jgi:hypothetical protein